VFEAEEPDEFVTACVLALIENGDGGAALGIGAGGIGDEADALAFEGGEIGFFELVNAEGNRGVGIPAEAQGEEYRKRDGLE